MSDLLILVGGIAIGAVFSPFWMSVWEWAKSKMTSGNVPKQ